MKLSILTTLGVLAAITGLASSVQAQQTAASNSRSGEMTLSGESLTTVESRTTQDDFESFFLDNSSDNSSTIASNSNRRVNRNIWTGQPDGVQVSDDVQVVIEEPLSTPINIIPGRQNLPFDGIDQVEAQVNLLD